jgi:hypothetical protein
MGCRSALVGPQFEKPESGVWLGLHGVVQVDILGIIEESLLFRNNQ